MGYWGPAAKVSLSSMSTLWSKAISNLTLQDRPQATETSEGPIGDLPQSVAHVHLLWNSDTH